MSANNLTVEGGDFYGKIEGERGEGKGLRDAKIHTDDHPDNSLLGDIMMYERVVDPETGEEYWIVVGIPYDAAEEPPYVVESEEYTYKGDGDLEIELEYTGKGEALTEDELDTVIVKVDGVNVSEYYNISIKDNGNVVIKFTESYLKTLKSGRHLVEIIIRGRLYKTTIIIP